MKSDGCFISRLKNYNNRRDYLIKIDYRNDFSDNLRLFIIKNDIKSEKEDVFKLDLIHEQTLFEEIIYSNKNNNSAAIAICAPEFGNIDSFKSRKFDVEVKEIAYPSIVFLPTESIFGENNPSLPSIIYKQVDVTKYHLSIKNAKGPYVLIFKEKFDSNWRIYLDKKEIFKESHFLIDSYANGWLADKTGDYDLWVEYYPQRLFRKGVALTIVSLIGIVFVIKKIYSRRFV